MSVSGNLLRNDGFTQWQKCRNFDLQCVVFSRVDLSGQIGGTYTNGFEHSSVSDDGSAGTSAVVSVSWEVFVLFVS